MSALPRFRGSLVALTTPFLPQDAASGRTPETPVDLATFRALVRRQVEAGTDGLVVCGTTGEAPTLTAEERRALVGACVEEVAGRVPVLAGVGTHATRTTCEEARRAQAAGADGLLVVTPYYNRPSQAGLEGHFGAVVAATTLPVVLYNVPARTGVDLLPATVARLATRHPRIVAIKEASASLERLRELTALGLLDVLCGDDGCAAAALADGAHGWIGVAGNLAPSEAARLVHGSAKERAAAEEALAPLLELLALGTNPVPVKAALERLGLAPREVRAPLCSLERSAAERVDAFLEAAGLLVRV